MAKKINDNGTYDGFVTYEIENDVELARFYEHPNENVFELLTNQYCILMHNDEVIDKVKWNGSKNVAVSYKSVNNNFMGKVKPRNIQQELSFDML